MPNHREIERLKAEGLSVRQIARALRISKSAVHNSLQGRRPPRRLKKRGDQYIVPLELGESRADPPVRCADCGGRIIVVPCRACRIQKQRRVDRLVRELAVVCPRCGPQVGRIKGREVRCRRCGKWLQCAPGR